MSPGPGLPGGEAGTGEEGEDNRPLWQKRIDEAMSVRWVDTPSTISLLSGVGGSVGCGNAVRVAWSRWHGGARSAP